MQHFAIVRHGDPKLTRPVDIVAIEQVGTPIKHFRIHTARSV